MKLPNKETVANDPFLNILHGEDEKGFLSKNKGSNQSFLVTKRYLDSFEAMKKFLPEASEKIKVADFACGTGNVGLLLSERGYSVDFVDNEEKFFDYIKLKKTTNNVQFIKGDCSTFVSSTPYDAIYFGEAIEHMSDPMKTLTNLRSNLKTGGILVLTTPNGDFVNCYEPNWSEVKDQKDRNEALANNIGNHVCEFTQRELAELVKLSGFLIMGQKLLCSHQISKRSILRRILPQNLAFSLDDHYSKIQTKAGKSMGRTQLIIAQRVH